MAEQLPTTLWFGMKRGQWPVYLFESEAAATHWMAETIGVMEERYLWRAELTNVTPLKLVPPSDPYLVEAGEAIGRG